MSNVIHLHGKPQAIAHFVRVGWSGHRHLEQLLASGRLPVERLVVEAGVFSKQDELVKALRSGGKELVLDTNVAELSSIGRFQGAAQGAPWASTEGILTPGHFRRGANDFDVVGKIARFAVEHGIRRVLAPTHLIQGVKDDWLKTDLESSETLRNLLDVSGGKDVAIDYPVLISNSVLNDSAERKALISELSSLPIDSLWLRISGFGADATGVGIRKYIAAAQDFRAMNRPIVADCVGGIAARAILAFGGACGVSHGIAERERFDTSTWNRPPKEGGGGGGYVVLLSGVDRLLKRADAEAIVAANGGRRLLSCSDKECCPHGFSDTMRDPKGHLLRQRALRISALANVPEQLRARHFIDSDLAEACRLARQAAKLKVGDSKLSEMLVKNSERLDRVGAVLGDLHQTLGAVTPPPGLPSAGVQSANTESGRH
jgi:hypothetical protein